MAFSNDPTLYRRVFLKDRILTNVSSCGIVVWQRGNWEIMSTESSVTASIGFKKYIICCCTDTTLSNHLKLNQNRVP